jgi:hypothetical protein
MDTHNKTNTNTITKKVNIKFIALSFLLLLDYGIYNFTKLIKTNDNNLKNNNCSISFNSRKVYILKNITFFIIVFLLINIVIPLNKYLFKIPLINGIYSLIIILIISIKLFLFNNIINVLNKENCLKYLELNRTSIKTFIIKYILKFNLVLKYKFLLSIIVINYIILKYI